jgi:hypothetical protein
MAISNCIKPIQIKCHMFINIIYSTIISTDNIPQYVVYTQYNEPNQGGHRINSQLQDWLS